jgi:hypothetical protein
MGWLEDLIGPTPDNGQGFENWLAPTDLFNPSQFIHDLGTAQDISQQEIAPAIHPYLQAANPLEFIPRAARALSVESPRLAPITQPISEATAPIADLPAQMLSDPSQLALLPLFSNPVSGALAGGYFLHQMANAGGEELGRGLAASDSGESPWGHYGAGIGQLGMAELVQETILKPRLHNMILLL